MKIFTLFTFLISFSYCRVYSQNDKTIKVSFSSGFLGVSNLSIIEQGDSSTLQLTYNGWKDKGTETISLKNSKSIQELNQFLIGYEQSTARLGFDGIDVSIVVASKGTEQKFNFWSPEINTLDAKFEELVYYLMTDNFKSASATNYLELMQEFMSFKQTTLVKKLSDDPLTFKLYGLLTTDKFNELKGLLNSLPADKKVFIDVSNFIRTGTMLYPGILNITKDLPNLYWLHPTKIATEQLRAAGVSDAKIITTD